MFELIAQGPELPQRWRSPLPENVTGLIGRDGQADYPVPWDHFISRRHARIRAEADAVVVEQHPEARNPLLQAGQVVESCRLRAGQHFVLGNTTFTIVTAETESSPAAPPVEEVTFNRQELRRVRFKDADRRIEVLTHLPEVIAGSGNDGELYHRISHLLLAGVLHAEAVAIVGLQEHDAVQVLHWERRYETAGEFRPSRRLVLEAIRQRENSILHVWEKNGQASHEHTLMQEFDWAYCTPIPGGAVHPWGIYVAGRLGTAVVPGATLADSIQLESDVKFTELVAEIISTVRRQTQLERQQSAFRQFFAPPILDALGDSLDTSLLEPRECDVTVMFCDLRGFSQRAEESAGNLIGLLERVSRALGVMTQQILLHGGVTGDFQGDAALGFWGWPFASDEAPLNACRAALAIRAAFEKNRRQKHHPLADFAMGIGIAHGRAVAGKIGTSDQVKVTVFGPVVNLASRLESMTKQLHVPILLDEATEAIVRRKLAPEEGRLRRLARVLPYGMETPVMVSELVPPLHDCPDLSDEHLALYEQGVAHFLAGRWEEAYHCLHQMPPSDRAQDFLAQQIMHHNRVAPPTWDGIVRMPSK